MRISDWSSDVCSSDLTSAVSLSFYAIVRRPHFGCCHALISASSTQPRSRAASGRPAIERGRRGGQSTEDGSVASRRAHAPHRSEEHTSELQALMRISYAVFCLNKKTENTER